MNEAVSKTVIALAEGVLKKKIPEEQINERLKDLGMHSINFVEFAVKIEAEFSFEFDAEYLDINQFETMKDIILHVEEKVLLS